MSQVVYSSHKGSRVVYAVVREQLGSCLLSSIIRDSPLVRKQYTRTVCYSICMVPCGYSIAIVL